MRFDMAYCVIVRRQPDGFAAVEGPCRSAPGRP
jgi:hypothetical protein